MHKHKWTTNQQVQCEEYSSSEEQKKEEEEEPQ